MKSSYRVYDDEIKALVVPRPLLLELLRSSGSAQWPRRVPRDARSGSPPARAGNCVLFINAMPRAQRHNATSCSGGEGGSASESLVIQLHYSRLLSLRRFCPLFVSFFFLLSFISPFVLSYTQADANALIWCLRHRVWRINYCTSRCKLD